MKIERIRKSLSENKIFFEVIVSSLVSFMAVYVSIQANKIAKTQTIIMKEELYPQIEIRMTQEYNDFNKIYDNNVWLFYNRGGNLSDFDIEKYSFYKFFFRSTNKNITIPIDNYFELRGLLSGDTKGLIFQIDNNNNGVKEIELRDSLSNFGYYEIENYVKVTFLDLFNESHEEFFQINPGIKRIDKEKWDLIKKNFIESKNSYSFANLSAKKIIELCNLQLDKN